MDNAVKKEAASPEGLAAMMNSNSADQIRT
jgi:hypothetical protein